MAALDWSACSVVQRVPGKVSSAWVFKDTRTAVAAIFENLEDGMTIDEVVEQFPVTLLADIHTALRTQAASPHIGHRRPDLTARRLPLRRHVTEHRIGLALFSSHARHDITAARIGRSRDARPHPSALSHRLSRLRDARSREETPHLSLMSGDAPWATSQASCDGSNSFSTP